MTSESVRRRGRFLLSCCALWLAASQAAPAAGAPVTFSPEPGVTATLRVRDHKVILGVTGRYGASTRTIDPDTEQVLRIRVEDYNFDGHPDFSIAHIDDGMGTYDLYDIWVYSAGEHRFVPLRPTCGDAFVNIQLLKKRRALVNSYMDVTDREYKSCTMKF